MPLFIGAIWKNASPEYRRFHSEKFSLLISNNTSKNLFKIDNSILTLCCALRKYENELEKIHILPNEKGIILGRIYPKEGEESKKFDHEKYHPNHYWGRYISILVDEEKQELAAFRDPLGLSHLYYIQLTECILISSDLFILVQALDRNQYPLNINWRYIASHLTLCALNTANTCFEQIKELLPGDSLIFRSQQLNTKFFWDPSLLLKFPREDSALQIVPTLLDVVKKLTSHTSNICLQISGGLDSTALYLTLKQCLEKNQNLILVNYLDKQVSGSDESEQVTKLIEGSGDQVIFHEWSYSFHPRPIYWDRPHPAIICLENRANLLEKLGENVDLYNGIAGDNLFLTNVYPSYATDYLLQKGIKGFMKNSRNISIYNRTPLISVLKSVCVDLINYSFKRNPSKGVPFPPAKKNWQKNDFLSLISLDDYAPPYWKKLINTRISPGKLRHLLDVYHASALSSFEHPGATELSPFLSQPLVEVGLSIPSHCAYNQDWSRLHFRKHIGEYFKTDSVWRKTKGDASGIIVNSIQRNLTRIKELCLEGQCAKNGFFDKSLLNAQIQLAANGVFTEQWPIVDLCSIELWFESWGSLL